MEHIKALPEIDDSEEIRVEAEALVGVSDNPGIKPAVFAALARAIVCTFPYPDYSYAQQRGKLERMALRYQVGVETERILKGEGNEKLD